MYYVIKALRDGVAIHERLSPDAVVARVDELAGRSVGGYIVTKALRQPDSEGRRVAYVATAKDSLWRQFNRTRGFIVEQVA